MVVVSKIALGHRVEKDYPLGLNDRISHRTRSRRSEHRQGPYIGFNDENVSRNDLRRKKSIRSTVANDETVLRKHASDGSHDSGGGPVLPCIESGLDEEDCEHTMARARLARAGGWPQGFHAMNTRMAPTRRINPNPLNKCPKICLKRWVGGGEGVVLPFSSSLRLTCSAERHWVKLLDRRWKTESVEMVCQSRLDNSRFRRKVNYVRVH